MRARLLQFVTGSSRVPLQGFKALQGKFIASAKSRIIYINSSLICYLYFPKMSSEMKEVLLKLSVFSKYSVGHLKINLVVAISDFHNFSQLIIHNILRASAEVCFYF